jgi:hypothetical protein
MMDFDPKENVVDALRTVALPHNYTNRDINRLFERGENQYNDEAEPLIEDIEQFFKLSLNRNRREKALESPPISEPATVAILGTLSMQTVLQHEDLQSTPINRLRLFDDIQELFGNTILGLIRNADNPVFYQELAEFLYQKSRDDESTVPGRICTGIVQRPELGDGRYAEIPLASASRTCIYREDDNSTGEIETRVVDNHLYVPLHRLEEQFLEYTSSGFQYLNNVQAGRLSADEESWLRENVDYISERIDRFFRAGQEDRIWKNWSRSERKLRFIVTAVQAADDDIATLGTELSADQIRAALDHYSAEERWERNFKKDLSSASSIAGFLNEQTDNPSVSVDRSNRVNLYELSGAGGSAKALPINDLEDLFELPCFSELDDRLEEEGPVRKDLYSLVRLILWLPRYQPDPDLERVVEDVKELFSRWSWYDPEETDYQVRNEYYNGKNSAGEDYLPLSCGNDTMQRYCIGRDVCDYSIYQSIDFPDEMYDQIRDSGLNF